MRIHNQQDFWSGVMFAVVGVAFAGFAQEYEMGTGQRMGPAFFRPCWEYCSRCSAR